MGYILVFIEPYIKIKWETYNAIEYGAEKTPHIAMGAPHFLWIVMSFTGLGGNMIVYLYNKEISLGVIVFHIISLIVIAVFVFETRFNKQRIESIKMWTKIKYENEEVVESLDCSVLSLIPKNTDKT